VVVVRPPCRRRHLFQRRRSTFVNTLHSIL